MTAFEEAIKALGETSEQVMAVLREKGIKGYKQRACHCPIANYLKACGFPIVSVGPFARLFSSDDGDSVARVQLNPAVQNWISNFDAGWYPEFVIE